jgi:hypothetical protein
VPLKIIKDKANKIATIPVKEHAANRREGVDELHFDFQVFILNNKEILHPQQ